jgi:hypothetical protein
MSRRVASAKATHGGTSLHALVLVLFGASVPLAVVDADVELGALPLAQKLAPHRSVPGMRPSRSANIGPCTRYRFVDSSKVSHGVSCMPKTIEDVRHVRFQIRVFQAQRQVESPASRPSSAAHRRKAGANAIRQARVNVEVSAVTSKALISVLFMQFGGVLEKRENAERHRGSRRAVSARGLRRLGQRRADRVHNNVVVTQSRFTLVSS